MNKIILFYGLFYAEPFVYDWIPYGLIVVYSLLKNAGFEPILIHEYKNRDYENIIKSNADDLLFLGISAMTGYQITSGINAVKTLRKYAPDVPVIWGGAHPTAMPYQTLKSEYADYVCVGFADQNIVDFAESIKHNKKIENIPDILSKRNIENNTKYSIKNYRKDNSKLPRILLKDFDFSYLVTENKILNYTASTGCPGSCAFCSWGGRHPWSSMPLEYVLDDIEYLMSKYALITIWFSDATLTPDKKYFMSLSKGILDRKLNIFWRCCSRVPELAKFNTSDFELLQKSGLEIIYLGIENLNCQNQKTLSKKINPEIVTEIVTRMKDFDINIDMAFIFGLPDSPGEDIEENREWFDRWKKININVNFGASFFTPYPGTGLGDLMESYGYIPYRTLEEYGSFIGTNRQVNMHNIELPWYDKIESEDYINRYYKSFPDCSHSFTKHKKRNDEKRY